jgi:hypothetical protein
MWWKLGTLALCTAALVAVLFAPIHVHMKLPPLPRTPGQQGTVVYSTPPSVEIATGVLVVGAIVGGAAWIAFSIVCHHRNSD